MEKTINELTPAPTPPPKLLIVRLWNTPLLPRCRGGGWGVALTEMAQCCIAVAALHARTYARHLCDDTCVLDVSICSEAAVSMTTSRLK